MATLERPPPQYATIGRSLTRTGAVPVSSRRVAELKTCATTPSSNPAFTSAA